MQQMMRRLSRDRHPSTPQNDTESLLFAASCANDAVDALNLTPPAKVGAAVAAVAQRYARALSIGPNELQDALKAARVALRSGRVVAEAINNGDDAPSEPAAAVDR
jgi:eukaryotic-like serine/threonine-protein kinase